MQVSGSRSDSAPFSRRRRPAGVGRRNGIRHLISRLLTRVGVPFDPQDRRELVAERMAALRIWGRHSATGSPGLTPIFPGSGFRRAHLKWPHGIGRSAQTGAGTAEMTSSFTTTPTTRGGICSTTYIPEYTFTCNTWGRKEP